MGILAAVAAPRFFEQAAFNERGFYDDTVAAVRYAQKSAIATGCDVQVTITASGYTLNRRAAFCSGAFTGDVYNPGKGETQYTGTAPSGLTLSPPQTLTLDALGQATGGDTTITLTGSGGDTRTITVVGETGFVY